MTDGILLLDKPAGPTSHDIVEGVRRTLGRVRCGHAGTLDPFASGLLVIALGSATRLLRFLAGSDKTYEGVVRLGFATDTDDATGRPLGEPVVVSVHRTELDRAVGSLTGSIEQLTPAFSARKHEGVPLYRLARQGREIPEKRSTVHVAWQSCTPVSDDRLHIVVTVSAGTYVRAIARDLGAALGTGGHLESLRRLGSGPFLVDSAAKWPSGRDALLAAVVPVAKIPLGLPTVRVPEAGRLQLTAGAQVRLDAGATDEVDPTAWVRIVDEGGSLVGIGELLADEAGPGGRLLQPRIILSRSA